MNIREDAAKFYDLQSFPIDDVPFYLERLPSPAARVLELGCGTGRVLLPLAERCGFIHGVDSSAAMLAICQDKLNRSGISPSRANVSQGDIGDLHVDGVFDLIIAPFRVLQLLETDAELSGLMNGIHQSLAPGGSAILNTFHPNRPREELLKHWCFPGERIDGDSELLEGGRLVRSYRQPRLQPDPLVLYPELVYRRYSESGTLEEEALMKIAMRCWYPEELERLVTDHGFQVTGKWAGYNGEVWGGGLELVIQFGAPS